jgi:hypothetical protein
MPEPHLSGVGDELEIDEDLLEDPPRAPVPPPRPVVRSRDADPDAITEPEVQIAPARPTPPVHAREVELSEEDLAGLDTSDLDVAIEPMEEGESLFDTSGVDLSADTDPQD